jgi:GWxTD domain-containing protein
MLVTASAHLHLTPLRPVAFYLLEAYSREQVDGRLNFRVLDSAGKALVTTAPIQVEVPAGGGVLKGQLDLDGLPPGRYTLVASLALGEGRVLRSAGFTMAELDETLEKDVVRREAAKTTDAGYFASLNGEQLDSALEPLTVVAERSELRGYSKELSPNAKRRFLTDFWRARDPTPETPDNLAREAFYRSIAYANQNFREGGRTRQGWKSDRGRIFLRNGPPEEILDQPHPPGEAPPYQVWRYRTGKDRWYCFADRSEGVGLYQLIHSSDIREQGVPNWGQILGPVALQDVSRFLGIDFFDTRQ